VPIDTEDIETDSVSNRRKWLQELVGGGNLFLDRVFSFKEPSATRHQRTACEKQAAARDHGWGLT
jgi:hypothetical protein